MPASPRSLPERRPGKVLWLPLGHYRCCTYFILGWLLAVGLTLHLKSSDNRDWGGSSFLLIYFTVSLLGSALGLWRTHLGVDDRGIWLQRFFGWDLWPWEASETGAISIESP